MLLSSKSFLITLSVLLLPGLTQLLAVSIPVSADASIRAALPTQNFGALPQVSVDASSAAYLRFDVNSALPQGIVAESVTQAILYLYVSKATTAGAVDVIPVCSAWDEFGLNFSNRPVECVGQVT